MKPVMRENYCGTLFVVRQPSNGRNTVTEIGQHQEDRPSDKIFLDSKTLDWLVSVLIVRNNEIKRWRAAGLGRQKSPSASSVKCGVKP